MTLRPHVAHAGALVRDIAPLAGGGYALLTKQGIQILDEKLSRRAVIEGESDSVLVVLSNDRFLVHGARMSYLYEGKVGGSIERVDHEGLVESVAVTTSGFHATTTQKLLVDHDGVRTVRELGDKCKHGCAAWHGGSVVAGYKGLAILAADGSIVAEASESLCSKPVAFAGGIAVPALDDVVLFDDAARVIGRIPYKVESDGLVPFQNGILTITTNDLATASELVYWASEGGVPVERWRVELAGHMQSPVPFGDRIALASYDTGLRIFDAAGTELAALGTTKIVDEVAPFAGGLAISVRDNPQVMWWRPGQPLETLDHDGSADKLRAAPAGLITAEGNVVFLWRTDEQGPEWTPIASHLPMNVPIVIGGGPVTITATGRFALRGVTPDGQSRRISSEATWRPLTTRDEAARLMERLVGRTFDGPLPPISDAVILYEVQAQLAQLPLAETVDLFGRTLFAQSTLDERTLQYASFARGSFFEELGQALGTSGRVLLAAVKSRKLKLEPPRPIVGYDYLGTFTTSGDLTVSDPCYIGKKQNPSFPLALKVQGHEGVWHVFVRGGAGSERDRNYEAVFIHDEGFEVYANEPIGSIGVDSGTAGVFDKKCPKRDDNAALEEGTFAALGAVVSTGYGDGFYTVLAGKAKGRVAKIRIHFIGDDTVTDRSMPKSTAKAKPYSASQKFAMGDTIQHVKFGTGSVVRVGSDGKIDVLFPDGTRTLVHAKK